MKPALLALLILAGCACSQQSIAPRIQQMDAALVRMGELAPFVAAITPGFRLSWPASPASDSVLWYNVYRSSLSGVPIVLGATTQTTFIDSLISVSVRYAYRITAHNRYGDSGFSPVVSGAWVSLGPAGVETKRINLYDTLWTARDLLVLNVPLNAPASWVWQRTPEKATWRNYLDVSGDCAVNLTDLGYWVDSYNKAGCDSVLVAH